MSANFPCFLSHYKDPILNKLAAPQVSFEEKRQKKDQKMRFRHCLEKVDQKLRFKLLNIGAKRVYIKILGSISQKWMS